MNYLQKFFIASFPGIYANVWKTMTEGAHAVVLACACVFFQDTAGGVNEQPENLNVPREGGVKLGQTPIFTFANLEIRSGVLIRLAKRSCGQKKQGRAKNGTGPAKLV